MSYKGTAKYFIKKNGGREGKRKRRRLQTPSMMLIKEEMYADIEIARTQDWQSG
jgi:hypothetical protein